MSATLGQAYLESVIKRQMTYKVLGDMTFSQLEEKDFHFVPVIQSASSIMPSPSTVPAAPAGANVGPSANAPVAHFSNSIAVIINHLSGNMLSRWTNFLTEDGEKPGRNRDEEFSEPGAGKDQLLAKWDNGWSCLLDTLRSLTEEDLLKTITIRHEPLLAVDAINRQLAHYPHHVGQIVYIGKMIRGAAWQSLSISKGASEAFNQFMQDKHARR
ncbi:MAG TPA: DUF1572 family protein [Puia sp.]|nr:DUF1572 family protein [Puia sp.]